jgi:hypothetical protein
MKNFNISTLTSAYVSLLSEKLVPDNIINIEKAANKGPKSGRLNDALFSSGIGALHNFKIHT